MARRWSTDFYAVLEVRPDADAAEVRRSYLRLARQHHPDRHLRVGAAERAVHDRAMREVNEAWSVLGDTETRRDYDEWRAATRSRDSPGSANAREARWAADDDAQAAWRPFDDRDVDGDLDPRLGIDEDPNARAPWRVAVAVLVFSGFGFLVGGLLSGATSVAAVGVVLLVAGGLAFLAAPLLALGTSLRNDRESDARRRAATSSSRPTPRRNGGRARKPRR